MKFINHIIVTITLFFIGNGYSQSIGVYIPDSFGLKMNSKRIVENKLKQLSTKNNFSINNSRFIVTAKIDELSNVYDEPFFEYELGVNFYIGDGLEGKAFESYYVEVQGKGKTQKTALRNALKSIRPNSELKAFFDNARVKIKNYYAQNCDLIIQEAQNNAKMGDTHGALISLSSIPKSQKECWVKANNIAVSIYNEDIEFDCEDKLSQAKGAWSANKDKYGAYKATKLLSRIDPRAKKCFSKVKNLHSEISREIGNDKANVLKLMNKELDNKAFMTKKMLDHHLKIELAKAKNKPNTTIVYKSLY